MSDIQRTVLDDKKSSASLLQSLEKLSSQMDKTSEKVSFTSIQASGDTFIHQSILLNEAKDFGNLSGEAYQKQVINPAESNDRFSIIKLVHSIAERVIHEVKEGPLYLAEIELGDASSSIRLGVIAQQRYANNGVWQAKHHYLAGKWAREFEARNIPVTTFIDTPGAEAGSEANKHNQAHSISELIATMADLKVPTVGIVWGLGYSGGAIPLATTNVLLAVKDSIFSTIQPKGLASIARKQKLDWQTCARIVGVSAPELFQEGVLDGVINYSPLDKAIDSERIKQAIMLALSEIEQKSAYILKTIKPISNQYHEESIRFLLGQEDVSHKHLTKRDIKSYPSIFGYAFSALRSLKLRSRIQTQATLLEVNNHDAASGATSPDEQQLHISKLRFSEWLQRSDKLIYEDNVFKSWNRYCEKEAQLKDERGYIASLLLGDPKNNLEKAHHELTAELAFHLYNRWQQDAQHHLKALEFELSHSELENDCQHLPNEQLNLIDVIRDKRLKPFVVVHCQQLVQFDRLYEKILSNLTDIVAQFSAHKSVSISLMQSLLNQAGIEQEDVTTSFAPWLLGIHKTSNFSDFLRITEKWKKAQHPRLSDVVFVVASYFFDKLYPEMFQCETENSAFSGQFSPVSIGRRKDFWNQLNHAIKDIRIQSVLNEIKPSSRFTPMDLIDSLFENFVELDNRIITVNPKNFPGFETAISQQLSHFNCASGLLTGTANVVIDANVETVGLFVSNHSFQAGAFDMSSAERFCRLLSYCGENSLPVVGFVCSGGMQTKEGASALFSMPVVNDQINRFVSEFGLPILIFGYGDCTGGAQASLVTHPLVDTYYFSGTNMPFAGRIVVPEYLPVTSTLSNYLIDKENSMSGLVKHPLIEGIDAKLQGIDRDITAADLTVTEVIHSWLTKKDFPRRNEIAIQSDRPKSFAPYQKVLVHARGCTAVKLIRDAHALNLNVVLVQSDPDMNSVAADMLKDGDNLVCLGGYTSDESYLNGASVLRIAEMYAVQALHPGIGFLSENSQFAHQCAAQDLNFVGPSPESMEAMGDKSRAIHTAIELGVPVVPGSHGLLRNLEHAEQIAADIGFPIILKAAHGGGGKGITVVEQAESLKESFYMIKTEARSSFGNGDIYLERLVTHFRLIEVQLLRDQFGCTRIIGLRDCSVQRNKQKIIEESFSTLLPVHQIVIAKESAHKLAEACDYFGAGTVEFIYDLNHEKLYFMEMNTRLQVEHPVTEMVSGVDIVKQQYHISMGKAIDQLEINDNGYALEVRVNAERVSIMQNTLKVVPTPGLVSKCLFPNVEGVKHIVTVDEGKPIPPYYDNLIAQIIVHANSRTEAIQNMSDYLSKVVIEGVDTNIGLLQIILNDTAFLSGKFDTDYLLDLVTRNPDSLKILNTQTLKHDSELDEFSVITVQGSEELKVVAPSTCVVYRSASPDQPAYIEEGDVVTVDQTLCLLEAMKMFQPLSLSSFNQLDKQMYPANQKYKVTHIKGVSDQQVNRGDLLFVIKPVKASA